MTDKYILLGQTPVPCWRRAWMDLQGIEPESWDLMRDRIEDRW